MMPMTPAQKKMLIRLSRQRYDDGELFWVPETSLSRQASTDRMLTRMVSLKMIESRYDPKKARLEYRALVTKKSWVAKK